MYTPKQDDRIYWYLEDVSNGNLQQDFHKSPDLLRKSLKNLLHDQVSTNRSWCYKRGYLEAATIQRKYNI